MKLAINIKVAFKAVFLQYLILAIIKYLYDIKNIPVSSSLIIWICCCIYCIIEENFKN